MEDKMMIPYIVYEGEQVRHERNIKRLTTVLIITIILLFVTNVLWINYLLGFNIETYDYTQDGSGVNIIGDRNGVDYNVSEISSCEEDPQEEISWEISTP